MRTRFMCLHFSGQMFTESCPCSFRLVIRHVWHSDYWRLGVRDRERRRYGNPLQGSSPSAHTIEESRPDVTPMNAFDVGCDIDALRFSVMVRCRLDNADCCPSWSRSVRARVRWVRRTSTTRLQSSHSSRPTRESHRAALYSPSLVRALVVWGWLISSPSDRARTLTFYE
jgi:hypothetical protein